VTSDQARERARRRWLDIKAGRIEDYQFTGGPAIPAKVAAGRLGVTTRTIERYRRELREGRQP